QESTTLDRNDHRTSFAPNVIHSLDAAHLMLTVTQARESNFDTPLGTIHDSFATCAADAPVLETIFKSGFDRMYGLGMHPLTDLEAQFGEQGASRIPKGMRPQRPFDVGRVHAASPLR